MKDASIAKTSAMSTTVPISAPLLRLQTRNVDSEGETIDRQERKEDRCKIGGTMVMRVPLIDVEMDGMVVRSVAGSSGEEKIEVELGLTVAKG